MTAFKHSPKGIAVPDGRISRLTRLGGMALGVAGNVAVNGGREWLGGNRPRVDELLLTPANLARITRQLAHMRGAAMKMGQLMSMETSDMLPPEMADILSHLRNDAHYMPPKQLKSVLIRNWGPDFLRKFDHFDVRPIAAASIGQVHKARTTDGRTLAIKIQYPGVRRSIDSDVANVATLLRMSGLLPRALDIDPLLKEAKRQLHQEADYQREARMLMRFGELLGDAPAYHVPQLHSDLSTDDILSMSFASGVCVDQLEDAPQHTRDHVASSLIDLMLRELFEFGLMQTDPNFANYSYDEDTGKIVLLDFGASRSFEPALAHDYKALLVAGLHQDRDGVIDALMRIGFVARDTQKHHIDAIYDMFEIAMTPLRAGGVFDFANSDLAARLRQKGMEFAAARDFWVVPPMDTLFLQRKIGGVFLLATRLRARVDLGDVCKRALAL